MAKARIEAARLPSGRYVQLMTLPVNLLLKVGAGAVQQAMAKKATAIELHTIERQAKLRECVVALGDWPADDNGFPVPVEDLKPAAMEHGPGSDVEARWAALCDHPDAAKDLALVEAWFDRRHGVNELEEAAFFSSLTPA